MILMKISGTSEIIDACQYKCYIILSHCITLMTYDDVFWIWIVIKDCLCVNWFISGRHVCVRACVRACVRVCCLLYTSDAADES